jgi:hypothetical protein
MKPLIILVLIISISSFVVKIDEQETINYDFGVFQLRANKNWNSFKLKGIDSYIGGLTNGKDTLTFDYGWYSSELEEFDNKKYNYVRDTINGLIGYIQIPKQDGVGTIKLSIPKVNDLDKFSLEGTNIKGTQSVLNIFKTITFKESDTLKNPKLSLERFNNQSFVSGKVLFNQNCASCHSKSKLLIGPILDKEFINKRTKQWLTTFFIDRNKLIKDRKYLQRKKQFQEQDCIEFNKDEKVIVNSIIDYLKDE